MCSFVSLEETRCRRWCSEIPSPPSIISLNEKVQVTLSLLLPPPPSPFSRSPPAPPAPPLHPLGLWACPKWTPLACRTSTSSLPSLDSTAPGQSLARADVARDYRLLLLLTGVDGDDDDDDDYDDDDERFWECGTNESELLKKRIQLRHPRAGNVVNSPPNVQTDLPAHIPAPNAIRRPDPRMLLGRAHGKRRMEGERRKRGHLEAESLKPTLPPPEGLAVVPGCPMVSDRGEKSGFFQLALCCPTTPCRAADLH